MIEPGRRFLERSTMATTRLWQHERIGEHVGNRARTVTDRLSFELRRSLAAMPGSARMARPIVGFLFRHRHRRLRARFGTS